MKPIVQLEQNVTDRTWSLYLIFPCVNGDLADWQKTEIKRLAREIEAVLRVEGA